MRWNRFKKKASSKRARLHLTVKRKKPGPKRRKILHEISTESGATDGGNNEQEAKFPERERSPCHYENGFHRVFEESEGDNGEQTGENIHNGVHENCSHPEDRTRLNQTEEDSGTDAMTNTLSYVSMVSTDSSCRSFLHYNNITEGDLFKDSDNECQPETQSQSNSSIISRGSSSCKSFLASTKLTEEDLYRDSSQDNSGVNSGEHTWRKPKSEKYMDAVRNSSDNVPKRKDPGQERSMEENYRILSVINAEHDYVRIIGSPNSPSIQEPMDCADNANSSNTMEEDSGDRNSIACDSPKNYSRMDDSDQRESEDNADRISSPINRKHDHQKIISSPPPVQDAANTADNVNSPNPIAMDLEDDDLQDVSGVIGEAAAECEANDNAENTANSATQEEQGPREKMRKPKKKSCDFDPEERSISKFSHVLRQLQDSFTDGTHGPFHCGMQHQRELTRVHHGLRTKHTLKCDMCNATSVIWSELGNEDLLDVDRSGVVAVNTIGGGFANLQEFCANMHIHSLNEKQYQNLFREVKKSYLDLSDELIKENAAEERRIAEDLGTMVNGIPTCPVIVDGSWPVRSYNNIARSEAGMAVIIGLRTGKVLWVGTRNKYCERCARAKDKPVGDHECTADLDKDQSVLSIESIVIREGFEKSVCENGLIYSHVIGDGDSNTYKAILDSDPYKGVIQVKKWECNVHLKRSRIKDIRQIIRTFKTGRSEELKTLKDKLASNISRICHAVDSAATYWRKQDTTQENKETQLQKDVMNIIHHVFGDHAKCAPYFCNGESKPDEVNLIPAMKRTSMYNDIQRVLTAWSDFNKDLLEGKTANLAETFNSVLAKYLGGKRCNVQRSNLYKARVAMAHVQFDRQSVSSSLHKKMKKRPPPELLAMEQTRQKRNLSNKGVKKRKKIVPVASGESQNMRKSKYYGRRVEKQDMSETAYAAALEVHTKMLKEWQQNRQQIEMETRCNVDERYRFKKNLLFSYDFIKICSMRANTPTAKTVKAILYPANPKKHIQRYEKNAKEQVKALLGENVQPCGIIIDENLEFLAAELDGFIGDDTILKIHTPWQVRDHSMTDKATLEKLKMTPDVERHSLNYEVQGALAITKRTKCLFVVANNVNATYFEIKADDTFWGKMVPKLTNFYKQWMTSEIVDSRLKRSMPLRDSKRNTEPLQRGKSKKKNNHSQDSISPDESEGVTVPPQREESRESNNGGEEDVEQFMPTTLSDPDKAILRDGQWLECTHMDVFGRISMEISGRLWEYRSPGLKDTLHRIKSIPPFQKHVQILNEEGRHWVCAYYDTESIFIYNSFGGFNPPSIDPYLPYLERLFPEYDFQRSPVRFPLVQQQGNFNDCGVYSIAFAISCMHGLDPSRIRYKPEAMRNHLFQIFENRQLTHFPLSEGECNITIPNINEYLEAERQAMSARARNFHREC